MTKFFGVGGAPEFLVLWMLDELSIFERLSCFVVEDCCGYEGIDGCVRFGSLGHIGKHD